MSRNVGSKSMQNDKKHFFCVKQKGRWTGDATITPRILRFARYCSFERNQGEIRGDGDYTIGPRGVLRLRHRYYFHRGGPREADVPKRFASYAGDERFHPLGTEMSEPRFIYRGTFIGDTTIPGEQKRNWVQPSHPYCWQLSQDRWLWVFQTRSFEGIDTERSINYQIRRDRPDGPVIRENVLIPFRDDWDPSAMDRSCGR